jgi:hypothetical protein
LLCRILLPERGNDRGHKAAVLGWILLSFWLADAVGLPSRPLWLGPRAFELELRSNLPRRVLLP